MVAHTTGRGETVDRVEEDVEHLRCFGDVQDERSASGRQRGKHRLEAIVRYLEEQILRDKEVALVCRYEHERRRPRRRRRKHRRRR
jgi:hypothetical protein